MIFSIVLVPVFVFSILCWRQFNLVVGMSMMCFLSVSGIALYGYFGHYALAKHWEQDYAAPYKLRQEFLSLGSIPGLIEKLNDRLADHPDDRTGWTLLGKLYLAQGQAELAKYAFQQAHIGSSSEDNKD